MSDPHSGGAEDRPGRAGASDRRSAGSRRRGRLVPARWAAVYLAVSAALIAVAGRELAGPSAEERARVVEAEAAAELGKLARTAAAVADSWARERTRREAERAAILESALAASVSWAASAVPSRPAEAPAGMHGTDGRAWLDAFDPASPLRPVDTSAAAADLAGVVPDGVAVAVIAPDGSPALEAGGEVDPDSAGALLAPAAEGLTVAVAWAVPLPPQGEEAARAIAGTLAHGVGRATGLYFVAPDGTAPAEVTPRPVPAAPVARPLAEELHDHQVTPCPPQAGAGLAVGRSPGAVTRRAIKNAPGAEAGILVTVRCPTAELGWTAVAERHLTSQELAEGASGVTGMIALTALGLVAAAAFAHAIRAAFSRAEVDAQAPPRPAPALARPLRPRLVGGPRAATDAGTVEPDPMPTGGSIVRLREALGAPGEGPDLAASARSPILRALSRYVRAAAPPKLPRAVGRWGRSVETSGPAQAGGGPAVGRPPGAVARRAIKNAPARARQAADDRGRARKRGPDAARRGAGG